MLLLEVVSYDLTNCLSISSPHPGSSPLPPDPLAVSIVTQCDTLQALVQEWEERGRQEMVSEWVAPETRQFLVSWLTGTPVVCVCVKERKRECVCG